jgi:hypothetical protein
MNSSRSTSDLVAARAALGRLQRQAYQELGIAVPDFPTSPDREDYRRYLASNPDITPSKLAEALAEFDHRSAMLAPNVVDLSSSPASKSILNSRVKELEGVTPTFDGHQRLARTCFGTVPRGGLDAWSFRVEGADE